ncbi:hypothetical protein B566_EDAN005150 [Ephemera danica]|nr:hypothetical protein B566_EDAN005150 [Ephemera danica]
MVSLVKLTNTVKLRLLVLTIFNVNGYRRVHVELYSVRVLFTDGTDIAESSAAASAAARSQSPPAAALTSDDAVLQTAHGEAALQENTDEGASTCTNSAAPAPTRNSTVPRPGPPNPAQERLCKQHALHQRRRDRAIFIDRFSRVFFPLSFSVLNVMYWTVFVEYYY